MPKRKPPYVPPKIEDIGLKNYLQSRIHEHNNLGYDEFVTRIDYGVSKSRIALDFGVTAQTITKWLEIYEKEITKI